MRLAIEEDVLTLRVDKRPESNDDDRSFHHIERRYGTFRRTFRLPKAVEREHVEATMKAGISCLRLTG